MKMVDKVISYNRMADMAITDGNIEMAAKYLLKLHKLEKRDKLPIGAYRLK